MAYNTIREVKLCLIGDSCVGKSSLVLRYVHDSFDAHPNVSLAASFVSKTVKINDQSFKYNIWDTAGQERFHSLAPMYYRGAEVVIIVYDITSESTFESVKKWVAELRQKGPQEIVIAIAGNKKDLEFQRKVSTETGQSYADKIVAVFCECSALTGENIEDLFKGISQKLPPEAPAFQHRDFPRNIIRQRTPENNVAENNISCCGIFF